MAKNRPPVKPADRDGTEFSPAADDVAAVDLTLDAEPGPVAVAKPAEADPRDAELAQLRAENARLKAAAAGPGFEAGRRYRVSFPAEPLLRPRVVQPADGEHPVDTYKREAGVVGTPHEPQVEATDRPLGWDA